MHRLVKQVFEEDAPRLARQAGMRQQRIREEARNKGKAVTALALELAHWTLLVSNLPPSLVSLSQAFLTDPYLDAYGV